MSETSDFEKSCQAPDGQVWVCAACGKWGKNSMTIGDEACFLNAVLCYETKQINQLGLMVWVPVNPKPPEIYPPQGKKL